MATLLRISISPSRWGCAYNSLASTPETVKVYKHGPGLLEKGCCAVAGVSVMASKLEVTGGGP